MRSLTTGIGKLWAPASCTLPTTEQPLRLAEFDELFTSSARRVEHEGTTARVHLSGSEGLADRVRDLAERESSCCSFFMFAVDGTDDGLVLRITVPPDEQDVLEAMVARARELAT